MSNAILGWPLYSDVGVTYTPTLSGGSWLAALPLTNLQDARLAKLARSSTDALADTRFKVDLGVDRSIRVISIPKHNLSSAGKWRAIGVPSTMLFDYEAGMDISTIGGTFSRASTATYVDNEGVVRTAAINKLRDDHFISSVRHTLLEGQRTNVALWSRDMTNAAWVKSNTTAALTQTGADGVANSASLLTATAANGTVLQTITLASSARFQSAYVKRVTGSGTINMTMDNGTTWTAITVTSAWTRVEIPTQTLANPVVGFRIVTSGDAIAVDYVQNEDGTFKSSVIPTTTATVTRSADSLYFTYTAVPQEMTVYVKMVDQGFTAVASSLAVLIGDSSTTGPYFGAQNTSAGGLTVSGLYKPAATLRSSTVTMTNTYGDTIELRGTLTTAGQSQWYGSKNGAAEVTGTTPAADALPAAWQAQTLLVAAPSTWNKPYAAFQSIRVAAGVQSLATMQTIVSDSGWLDAWPSGETAETTEGMNLPLLHVLSADFTSRYWHLQFSDVSNADTYIDLHRLVIAKGWQPTINMRYGSKIGLETATTRTESDGGAAWFNRKAVRRNAVFSLEDLPEDEMLENGFDLQRIAGTDRQIFFIFDPSDTTHAHRRSFLAVLRELTALDFPWYQRGSMPFALVEEL